MERPTISVMWAQIMGAFEKLNEDEKNIINDMADSIHSFDEDPLTDEQKENLNEIYNKYFELDGTLKSKRTR